MELKLDSSIIIEEGESWPKELPIPRNDMQSLVDEIVANPTGSACSMHGGAEQCRIELKFIFYTARGGRSRLGLIRILKEKLDGEATHVLYAHPHNH